MALFSPLRVACVYWLFSVVSFSAITGSSEMIEAVKENGLGLKKAVVTRKLADN